VLLYLFFENGKFKRLLYPIEKPIVTLFRGSTEFVGKIH